MEIRAQLVQNEMILLCKFLIKDDDNCLALELKSNFHIWLCMLNRTLINFHLQLVFN